MTTRAYRLVLPPGWIQLPLDPARTGPAVRRVVDRHLADLPRDSTPVLRRDFEKRLLKVADDARSSSATDLLLMAEQVGDAAIAASCLITVAPAIGAGVGPDLSVVAARMGEDAVEQGVVEIGAGRAVRIVRHREADADSDDQLPSVVVEYVVPIPDRADHLMLSFSTPKTPIAEAMVGLFDAMAGTLQWRSPAGDDAV